MVVVHNQNIAGTLAVDSIVAQGLEDTFEYVDMGCKGLEIDFDKLKGTENWVNMNGQEDDTENLAGTGDYLKMGGSDEAYKVEVDDLEVVHFGSLGS